MIRNCEFCSQEFRVDANIVKRGFGKFCGKKCFDESRKKRVSRVCELCGVTFEAWPSLVTKGHARFCSDKCARENHKGERLISKPCEVCGKEFLVKPAHAHKRKRCSLSCMAIANRKFNIIVCEYCGISKEFPASKQGRKFCSKECYSLALSKRLTKDVKKVRVRSRHFTPKKARLARVNLAKYPPEFNSEFRAAIRRRDNYTCAICKKVKVKEVHHINYDKSDTRHENCVTLCKSCHSKTNGNRRYWQRVLTEYLADKGDISIRPAGWRIELSEDILISTFNEVRSLRQMQVVLRVTRRSITKMFSYYGYQVVRVRAKQGRGWNNYLERI